MTEVAETANSTPARLEVYAIIPASPSPEKRLARAKLQTRPHVRLSLGRDAPEQVLRRREGASGHSTPYLLDEPTGTADLLIAPAHWNDEERRL